ncbi:DUF4190 domain-containing protein [Bifidobacterium samirii]|nr:DUF4190 domain-containing protein [Bifidobacterium samirii]
MPTNERWNVLCIVGFVLAFVIPPVGVILSAIALVQINRTRERSRGLSIAGIVVGGVLTALWVVGIVFVGWAIDTAIRYSDDQGSSHSYSYDYNDADCPVEIDGECYSLDDLEREWGDFDWDDFGVGGLDASKWVGDTPNGTFGTDFDVDFGGETVSEPVLDVRGVVAVNLLG